MELAAHYGTTTINYTVEYSTRRTIAIEVHPDLSVKVVAPQGATDREIGERVLKRARWIRKHQRYFEEFLPRTPKREYVSGESHYYLGRKYILRVRKAQRPSVKLRGADLVVAVTNPMDKGSVKIALGGWYYENARKKFDLVLSKGLERFKSNRLHEPPLILRRMIRRWGSCTSTGKIIVNPEIIKAPTKCIEYVINHELCHLVHPNHGRKFLDLQNKVMPGWERWKMKLEKVIA